MGPLVSIITVCYNERERIEETLKSSVSQSYENVELIVIDGGSSDGTTEVLYLYEDHLTHLLVEADDGVYHAMNKGLALATGEYVIFMNGGDKFYDCDVISNIFLHNEELADIMYGNVAYIYPNGDQSISYLPNRPTSLFLTFDTICHQAMACRRILLNQYGGFDTRYRIAADYDFLMHAVLRDGATTAHLPITIAFFHKDGLSFKDESRADLRMERLSIQEEYLGSMYYRLSRAHQWVIGKRNSFLLKKIRGPANSFFQRVFKPREIIKKTGNSTDSN